MSLSVLLAGPTTAADLPGFDWSGLYVGGHVAYGRGHASNTLFDPDPSRFSRSFGSLYGGLQMGYNYVFPSRLLLGAEADVSFPNFLEDGLIAIRTTTQGTGVTDQVDYIATVRGRIGYTFEHWLVYGTGGFAWSQARLVEAPGLGTDLDKVLATRTGWVTGLGAEVAIAPDWTARFEYVYDHFGSVSARFPSGSGYTSAFDLHMLRLGLNYKMGGTGPADSALKTTASDTWPIAPENWNVHGQFTLIGQGYPSFRSPYEGPQSLTGASQFKNTTTATAFIGIRPWQGGEFYLDPELMQGFGLSDTFGLAGFPNGEAQKSNFPMGRFNIARAYFRQTFGLGGEQETIP